MTSRRTFIAILPLSATLVGVLARAQGMVDEKDPQAASLGFVSDTSKADATKFPKHTADQMCGGCQLFGGGAGAASGPCTLFGGKTVPAKGWCSAWVKKAG